MPKAISTAQLLHHALQACARSRSLVRRIEDGKVHEDMLLVGAYDLACEAGLPARLLGFRSSNAPLEMRDAPGTKPDDYHYRDAVFLEVDGCLLRLNTQCSKSKFTLTAERFNRQEDAERAHGVGEFGAWQEENPSDWSPEARGVDEIASHNDISALRAGLQQAALQQRTPPSPRSRSAPRL